MTKSRSEPRTYWNQKFKPEMLFTIYEMAKVGSSPTKIADVLGVRRQTMMDWVMNRPEVTAAFEQAKTRRLKSAQSFQQYVYDRLSPKLRDVWDEIRSFEGERNAQKRVEKILRTKGIRVRQHLFVHSLIHSNFNPSEACRMVNISKSTLEAWVRNDPDFCELLDEINWHKGNYFEGKLVGLVEAGVPSAIIFANRTFNRKRGYGNTLEVNTNIVNNTHVVVDIDSLDLPIAVRKAMLDKIRAAKQMPAELPEHIEDAEVIGVK